MPKFSFETIEDYYVYIVHMMGVAEDTFWNCSLPFLLKVIENKTAYEQWNSYAIEKARARHG